MSDGEFGTDPLATLHEELETALDTVEDSEVQCVCRDSLADYKIPRQVELADDLPKMSTRKIDQVPLHDRFG